MANTFVKYLQTKSCDLKKNIFAALLCGILVLIIFCQWVSPVEIFTGWDDGGARLASGCWRLGRPTQPIFKRKYFHPPNQFSRENIFSEVTFSFGVCDLSTQESGNILMVFLPCTLPLQTLNIKNIWWNWLIGHSPPHLPVRVTALPHPLPPHARLTGASRKPAHDFKRSFMIFLRISRIFRTFSCSFAFLGLVLSPPRVVGCRQVPPQSGTRPQTYDSVTPKPSSQWQRDLVSSNYKGGFQINTFQ